MVPDYASSDAAVGDLNLRICAVVELQPVGAGQAGADAAVQDFKAGPLSRSETDDSQEAQALQAQRSILLKDDGTNVKKGPVLKLIPPAIIVPPDTYTPEVPGMVAWNPQFNRVIRKMGAIRSG